MIKVINIFYATNKSSVRIWKFILGGVYELKKVKLDNVKLQILEYLDFDYGTTNMFIDLCDKDFFYAYILDESLILQNMRYTPLGQVNDYKIFNFNLEKSAEFMKQFEPQLKPNDFVFFYADIDIIFDSLSLLNKEIFLCKKSDEIFTYADVYKLNGGNSSEVMEFIDVSLTSEKQFADESVAIDTIGTIKIAWQDRFKEDDGKQYYCIKYDCKIAGISEVFINSSKNKALLANIYISQQFRGKGFGKRLLLSSMTEKNYTYYSNCHKSNINSLNTAISAGFQEKGIMSFYIKK